MANSGTFTDPFAAHKAVLLRASPYIDGWRVVLARVVGHDPYVTWEQREDDGSCHWGHYFQSASAADDDYAARSAR